MKPVIIALVTRIASYELRKVLEIKMHAHLNDDIATCYMLHLVEYNLHSGSDSRFSISYKAGRHKRLVYRLYCSTVYALLLLCV
jgi:hypothetical protein